MIHFAGVQCIRCRGAAYLEDDTLACRNCGRLLALLAVRPSYTIPEITDLGPDTYNPEHARVSSVRYARVSSVRYGDDATAACLERLRAGESIGRISEGTGIAPRTLGQWWDRHNMN